MDCRTQLASMAIEELDKGDFLMATKILTTSIRLEPNNHELYFERSICHHKLGDYKASLDDANAAIGLNSSDYTIYYQRGLALIGLSLFPEAVASFKKAIELRAKQDDSKLSDIFKLLRDATNELNTARRKPSVLSNQTRSETVNPVAQADSKLASQIVTPANIPKTNNEPVDSTTDKPGTTEGQLPTDRQDITVKLDTVIKNGNGLSNLVANSHRNQASCVGQTKGNSLVTNRVSSSASQPISMDNQNRLPTHNGVQSHHAARDIKTPENSMPNVNQHTSTPKSTTSSSYDWNIRRSERIFLHNTNEPGTSGSHDGTADYMNQKHRSGSNPSSISSGKNTKRSMDIQNAPSINYQPARSKSKARASSFVDSDVDVDDSNYDNSQYNFDLDPSNKRVMVAPSSSMPATSHASTSAVTNDKDSYSSKYKRLRRDRERARRGTSKLCTIKPSDLEDLHKSVESDSTKRSMRVIAPIDGWLYSGQLSVDETLDINGQPQYVVKLDGDSSGSSYLFTQSTVLNDVIKEVRVKTVSELRKGARICCYWSRTYKCLSTGVVTSRTFEATKSLVSVKYDNGDLSALPLEDLRLLPPDYPKYMSNCDPLLLAKNGDGSSSGMQSGSSRILVSGKLTEPGSNLSNSVVDDIIRKCDETELVNSGNCGLQSQTSNIQDVNQQSSTPHHLLENKCTNLTSDDSIPPTNETIDFITGDDIVENHDEPVDMDENHQHDIIEHEDTNTQGITIMASRASSEENNYNVEYQPWRFEGAPKRTKRNGRIYRDNYLAIRRGNEVLRVGDSAELMPRDESILPFVAKIDGFWANTRGEMRVRVRWYYRLVETEGEPYELQDGENALFETDHFDENDVQSIWRSTKILSWTDYNKNHMKHVNKPSDGPKIFYLAGYYDPVRRIKHLRTDVKESQ